MDLKQVVKLLKLMEKHGLDEVEVEQGDLRIRLKKSGPAPIVAPVIAASVPVVPSNNGNPNSAGTGVAETTGEKAESTEEDTVETTSPMVGTFYRSSTPDADSFVDVGDHVTPDQAVCIIEAMKVMNEIKAETEGEVIRILVENGESVEYGQPLMVIRRTSPPTALTN